MKLYNNSQKTPHGESLHKVKQNCKTPCQKNEGLHGKYNCQQLTVSCEQYGRKKHPEQFHEITEKSFHAQNTQAGSWYTQRQLGSFYSIRF